MIKDKLIALQKLKDGGLLMTFRKPQYYISDCYRLSSIIDKLGSEEKVYEDNVVSFRANVSYQDFVERVNGIIDRIANLSSIGSKNKKELEDWCSDNFSNSVYFLLHLSNTEEATGFKLRGTDAIKAIVTSDFTNLIVDAVPEEKWHYFSEDESNIRKV